MKKIFPTLVQRPRSLGASIVRVPSFPATRRAPSTSLPNSSAEAEHSRPDSGNRQLKPFFIRWLDTWRSQNRGVRQ
jgi:hypothetical protein